jgi:AcrR family transcriptional regulator
VLRRCSSGSEHRTAQVLRRRPNLLAAGKRPPEPRQSRSRKRHARLERAALALFGAKGYQGTSIQQIAERANLPVGSFYQHFSSKRQLLLALMDELLEKLSQIDFRPQSATDLRAGLRGVLARAFSADLTYLGAYRAWREAAMSDPDLQLKQRRIHAWTSERVLLLFRALQQLPGARREVDVDTLARAMDAFFWSLLGQAVALPKVDLDRWLDSATHLIFHALFEDSKT